MAESFVSSGLVSLFTSLASLAKISAFFSSTRRGGIPPGASWADNNNFHNEFMNLGVFFSRNPVKLSCSFLGSGLESVVKIERHTEFDSSRSEKA
jgi:hypothetical protein